jgi:hypothetical protein
MTAVDERDHPLNCHWRPVRADAFDNLGLPLPWSKAAANTRIRILTEAFLVGRSDPRAWISYSRRRGFYSARRGRYWSTTYTYDLVVPTLDLLASLGVIDHEKMPPGNLGWQSRFKASHEFLNSLNEAPPEVVQELLESIILRDHAGNLVDYSDTEQTRRSRRKLEEINEFLRATEGGLQGHPIREGDPLRVANANLLVASIQLHRVFNRSRFSLGGRFYGGWWQNVPSETRENITISGKATVELDYPWHHASLMYVETGSSMQGDPYDLENWPRWLVKIALHALVNADVPLAALRAIANEIDGEGAYAKAKMLVEELGVRHRSIAPFFGTGAGLRLMRRDSDMTESIMLRLNRKGMAVLPIHDSYIVVDRSKEKGELMEAMAGALRDSVGDCGVRSTGYRKDVPQ